VIEHHCVSAWAIASKKLPRPAFRTIRHEERAPARKLYRPVFNNPLCPTIAASDIVMLLSASHHSLLNAWDLPFRARPAPACTRHQGRFRISRIHRRRGRSTISARLSAWSWPPSVWRSAGIHDYTSHVTMGGKIVRMASLLSLWHGTDRL
jgi:hypothetical protein